MKTLENFLEWGGIRKNIICLIVSAAALVLSIAGIQIGPVDLAWVSIILCGIPIILEAITGLVTAFDIKADVLVSIALVASVIIGEDFAAGEVAFIMQLGALLEELTVARARAGIEKLVHLTPTTARRIDLGKEEEISAEDVRIGDVLRVKPGETIPVDGIIKDGSTSINQAVMTGESLPVDKNPGDEVFSGTVNQFGSFDMVATKVNEDSSIQRMIRLVQSADAGNAKIVGIADRWATWIVVIALSAAFVTGMITGEIIRAVTILVVFCPCALVLATPTAIMAAIGNAAKHGFLVKEGDALERLAQVKRITFDKTGTITYGRLRVVAVRSFHSENGSQKKLSEDELFLYTASIEARSEHPLGKAVFTCFKEKMNQSHSENLLTIEQFCAVPGKGVMGIAEDCCIMAGNREFLNEHGINIPQYALKEAVHYMEQGCTIIYVAADYVFCGFMALSDTLRPNISDIIEKIKSRGIVPVLLTGDNEKAAAYIAGCAGIDDVHDQCRPEDKLRWIDAYQKQKEMVCMIGDGINDAPALKKAHVGIAMGKGGSDIAVDAADIALVDDEIRQLPHLLALSRRMMITIKCNLSFSMILNFTAIILAMTGILNPVVGALVHNAGSILVIINSAFLLKWRSVSDTIENEETL